MKKFVMRDEDKQTYEVPGSRVETVTSPSPYPLCEWFSGTVTGVASNFPVPRKLLLENVIETVLQ